MFQVNDMVMYKREVCKIKQIKEKYYQNNDYYELVPVSDQSLKIDVPVTCSSIKNLITKQEIEDLIGKMATVPVILCDTKLIEKEYKSLLATENYEDLIQIIKTTYIRNKERALQHKKLGDRDQYYFTKAENYLYQEFAIVLDMSIDEVRDYILKNIIV